MPQQVLHPQWRNEWETTHYPFGDRSTLTNGRDVIVEGCLLDAHLYPIGGKERLYLSRILVSSATVTVSIGDPYNATLASGRFSAANPPELVNLEDVYGRPAGVLVSEPTRIALLQTLGIGLHEFALDETEFAATCCMPTPEIGVRGIVLDDGSLLTGNVWLVGRDGVVLRREQVTVPGRCGTPSRTLEVIRVDVVGDPLFRRRLCDPNALFETPNPIRRIRIVNGETTFECPPSALGNITIYMNDSLVSDPALRIRQTREGLVLEVNGSTIRDA